MSDKLDPHKCEVGDIIVYNGSRPHLCKFDVYFCINKEKCLFKKYYYNKQAVFDNLSNAEFVYHIKYQKVKK